MRHLECRDVRFRTLLLVGEGECTPGADRIVRSGFVLHFRRRYLCISNGWC